MILSGKTIELIKPTSVDVDAIFKWENDPEHWLVSYTVAPYSRDQILRFVENDNDLYADQQMRMMIYTKSHERAGCVDLFDFDPKNKRVGIGILVDAAFRGKGIGYEAIELITQFCFVELEMHSVYAEVLENNASSQHLFESSGYTQKGVKRDWVWNGSQYLDQLFYQRFTDQ
ncbi:MAG: GNAT family N-acetyltransferase [Cryomorphaceae bacterium]